MFRIKGSGVVGVGLRWGICLGFVFMSGRMALFACYALPGRNSDLHTWELHPCTLNFRH